MAMSNRFLCVLLALCACINAPAHAATLEGQTFEDSAQLANSTLQLNGLGVRTMFFVRVYVAGLYLSAKASSLSAVVATPGPKRLQIRMMRSAGAEKFNDALMHGIRNNTNATENAQIKDRVAQLSSTIVASGEIAKGDVINFDYLPELGTVLSINGKPKGTPMPGVDFYNVVLRIFMGEKPVDTDLKEGLLGATP